jgi:hypothetical protein
MADVFISYAKADRNLAQQLAAYLEAQGCTTWWDAALTVDEYSRDAIAHELEGARKIVVLWSHVSTDSPFVLHDAIAARDAGKLVQTKTSDIRVPDIPRPFREFPLLDAVDLAGIARAVSDREEKPSAPPVQAKPTLRMPLGRLDGSNPAIATASSDTGFAGTMLGMPSAKSPSAWSRAWAALRSMGPGTAIFALAAALVAAADIGIFWYYGVFDGLSGLGTKLLALLAWNMTVPVGLLPRTREKTRSCSMARNSGRFARRRGANRPPPPSGGM